jgi:hypothetical protein
LPHRCGAESGNQSRYRLRRLYSAGHQVLNAELAKQGIEVNHNLCEHFAFTRQELFT